MPDSPLLPHLASPKELKERMEAERSGLPFLVYRNEDGEQELCILEDAASRKITIGRDGANDVPLTWDSQVSSVHAELERIGGHWAITDDGLSRNGTYVNSERVHGRCRLRDGDMLQFGETSVVYRAQQISDTQTSVPSDSHAPHVTLSEAQRRVLVALCRPYKDAATYATPATNRQIAEELFLSVDAVKTHLRTLFQKFAVEDLHQNKKRAALVERAFTSGLVSGRDL